MNTKELQEAEIKLWKEIGDNAPELINTVRKIVEINLLLEANK